MTTFQILVPTALIKKKVLIYTSYKGHFELYSEIRGSTASNTGMTELARKDIILLSDVALILSKAGLRTVFQDIHIKFTLSVSTYSIADFKAVVYHKDKIGQCLKSKTQSYSYQHITHLKPRILFWLAWYTRQWSWKDYMKQISSTLSAAHPLIYHFPRNHYNCTISKSKELQTK